MSRTVHGLVPERAIALWLAPVMLHALRNHSGGGREEQMARLTVNGQTHNIDVEPDTPLLWAIRENVGLTGTKYGCGIAQCGACTVHIDGEPVRSCSIPVSAAEGKQITTIEGLAQNGVRTRSSRPGSTTRCRNAAIAKPA
jgi:ferredoxin